VYLHTRPQELSACNPVPRLPHTPGLRVRRDPDRARAFGYTEQEVSREEANEFVHFGDWCPGATVGMNVSIEVKSPEIWRRAGDYGCNRVGEKESGTH